MIFKPKKVFTRQTIASFICLAALVAAGSVSAVAQSDSPGADDKQLIVQLLKRIEALESAQKEMQQKMAQNAVQAAPSIPPPAPVQEEVVVEPEPSARSHALGPVQLRGYSDVSFGRPLFEKLPLGNVAGGGLRGSPNSFNIGDFDLFVNSRISDHWSVLGELLITSDFSNQFGAEMDRLLVTYRANDYFNVSMGKFNTSLGYYPNAFHRARYFQTATGRPLMYADEDNGGILPLHSVGITATGKIPTETLGLHWVAEIANGRPANSTDVPVQNFVDENNGKAVNFALYARPEWLSGFEAGVSVYRDKLHPVDLKAALGQTIFTGHIVYVSGRMEWLNEASLVRHSLDGTDRVWNSNTMYTQVSRAFGRTSPYFRFDYQNVPETDPIFGLLGRRSGPSIGLNRKLANYANFKLQYSRLANRALPSVNDVQAQVAFAF